MTPKDTGKNPKKTKQKGIVVDGVETLEQRFGALTKDGKMVSGDTRANLHERL